VIHASTGQIVQMIGYDAFGDMLADSAPGFQPFGFAGGLWDPSTRLVRFGGRDYDPQTGRWMTADPLLFTGQETNLYAYVFNDPVNLVDWDGLRYLTAKEGQKIANEAKTWTGTPYYSGGGAKSTKGTEGKADCSGSVWGIYRNAGYPYAYKASADFPSSPNFRPAPDNKPQVGDVAWWNGHVAIYDPNAANAEGAPKDSVLWSARRAGKPFGPAPLKWWTESKGPVKYYRHWIPDDAPAGAAPAGPACSCPIKK
jgi:RHS repeat-associated protein